MDNEVRRIALYISPGWHDFPQIYQSLIRETYRVISRQIVVFLLGNHGYQPINDFCKSREIPFGHQPVIPTMLALKAIIKPDVLMVYTKEMGRAFKYGIKVVENLGITVLMNLKLQAS